MRVIGTAMLALLAVSAGAQTTEPQPQYSVGDIEKALEPGEAPPAATDKRRQPRIGNTRGFSMSMPRASDAKTGTEPAAGRSAGRMAQAAPKPRSKDLLISFANASSELTDQAKANARVVATALTSGKLATARFAIDGHTNAVGNRAYNLDLSKARAQALADFLVGLGVDRGRLEVNGYGFDRLRRPSAPTAAENRRVEARLLN